jgi:hypothetical protein
MRKLLSILIVGGLSIAPAFPAQSKPRTKSASHRKARRSKKGLRRRAQTHAKRNNKANTIPKSPKLV